MIRGTTASFEFQMPYDFENDISYINVVFWQQGNDGPSTDRPLPIIKCNKSDFVWDSTSETISVTFAPEETARFVDDKKAYIQMTATTINGVRFGSYQKLVPVYPIYNDSELGDIVPSSQIGGLIILDGEEI